MSKCCSGSGETTRDKATPTCGSETKVSQEETAPVIAASGCCGVSAPPVKEPSGGCCGTETDIGKPRRDWLLIISGSIVAAGYLLHLTGMADSSPQWLMMMSHGIFELMNTMWWGVLLAALFVGLLGRIPQDLITAVLGKGGSVKGVWRATLAGTAMDLCSHGILMVGARLYQRGASLGQVMAFLIASPWNSFSLTIILVTLIGLSWTLTFIALSLLIAVVSGVIFDRLVSRGVLPDNPASQELPEGYRFWPQFIGFLKQSDWSVANTIQVAREGIVGSKMVLRWLLFGVVIATLLRGFLSLDDFQNWFGPTALGLIVTLVAATIIEVCSEGSTPIAADLVTRAGAPGNGFAFMMTGVSTDYTEIMVLREATSSWKIALFLPLVTVPQVIVIAAMLNGL